jgi:transposase-like protein
VTYAEERRQLAEQMPEELPGELPEILLMPEIEAQQTADKISKRGADRALRLRWKGASQTRCAKALGVDRDTLRKWLDQGREDYRQDWAALAARWDAATERPLETEEGKLEKELGYGAAVYRLRLLAPDEFPPVTEARQIQGDVKVRNLGAVDLSEKTDEELRQMTKDDGDA